MPTFLVTSKMSPELAARVEASVTGRKSSPARRRLVTSVVRAAVVLALAWGVTSVVATKRREQHDFERARGALLETVRAEAASVTDDDRQAAVRIDAWLVRLAGPYEGDFVSPDATRALFERPAVYVRTVREAIGPGERVAAAAHESVKDSFLACLLDPPASRTEKALLAKGRIGLGGGARMEEATPNACRVDDARAALPFFEPAFARSVEAAVDIPQVAALRTRFEKAPIAQAKRAMRAELLIAVLDEAETGSGPTEIDGARAHDVRIAAVDLRTSQVLLRTKRHVDPAWISAANRAQYASVLDSCALAFDVREALRK
ncbi:hypothetical protein LVJ94_32110 [Pendulispora rubella]|uniref:Uncharacterized protein n=1 Tax=Pendulispora rubella TaxID=2741070 RepID=A0ABZ2KS86_9BACT